GVAQPKAIPVMQVARFMVQEWRTYVATIGGGCIKTLLALGPGLWLPTMLYREFGWALSDAGLWLGVITIVCSPIGMVAGGKLVESWTRRGRIDAALRVVL